MELYNRSGFKWSINEILRLQREYELLELDMNEIAVRHERTPTAIMYKLDNEGFANYDTLYFKYHRQLIDENMTNLLNKK